MGRGKIEIKRIENSSNRQVTYSKRRNGIMKKAKEITVLCDAQVSLVIFASSGKMHEYCSPSTTLVDILDKYHKQSGERLWDAKHEKENDSMQIELRHLKGEDITSLHHKELMAIEEALENGLGSVREKQASLMILLMEYIDMMEKNKKMLEEENKHLNFMLAWTSARDEHGEQQRDGKWISSASARFPVPDAFCLPRAANSAKFARENLEFAGLGEILVRKGGGRSVVLTFNSSQAMKEGYDQLKGWIYDWWVSVTEWRKEVNLDQQRCVWLCCYGALFNLWNANTFKSIGSLWGEIIQVVEVNNSNSLEYGKVRLLTNSMKPINMVISLEYKGNKYPVRICETFDFHEDVALKFSAGNDQISVNREKRVWRQKTVLSSNSNKSNESPSTINRCVKRNGFYGGAVLNLVQMIPFNLRSVLGPQHKYGRVHSLFWRPKSTAIDLGVSIGKNKIVQVPYELSSLFSIGPKGIVEGVDVVEKSSIPIVSSNSIKIEESSRRHEGGGVHKASYLNNASQRNKEWKKKFLKASLVLPKFKRWGTGFSWA
ncbi:unnamed protein product [Camellia sinensis]